jgi:hypothetical protein
MTSVLCPSRFRFARACDRPQTEFKLQITRDLVLAAIEHACSVVECAATARAAMDMSHYIPDWSSSMGDTFAPLGSVPAPILIRSFQQSCATASLPVHG